MSKGLLIAIIVLVVLIAVLVALYFFGKRAQKKQDEQEAQMAQVAQNVTMLVIDKKKMKIKDAGLPQIVLDQTPKMARLAKYPVVKAKVGPKVMTLMCDPKVYDVLPVKRECKCVVSGLYITKVLSARGGLEIPEKQKKKMAKQKKGGFLKDLGEKARGEK